jgi:sulfur-oxidizing protein SoxB
MGGRIGNMMLNGKAIDANRKYKVAGWAPVAEGASGEPIWELMAQYLRDKKSIKPKTLNLPELVGMKGNAGIA